MRASFGASTSATVVVPRSLRFRVVVLLLRMCCLNALLRRNLPLLVRLKRLAAPRCVLIFSFFAISVFYRLSAVSSRLRRCRGLPRRGRLRPAAAARRLAAQDGVHLVAFHPRHRFRDGDIGQLLHQALEDAAADLRVRHLAAAEEDRRLDLVAFFEEALDVLLLELVVVLVDLRPELDLLDLDHLLVPTGLAG